MSAATEFDAWLRERVRTGGAFTALIVLVAIAGTRIDLLRSAHLHVVGDETAWDEIVCLFDGSGVAWDGAAFFVAAGQDALVEDAVARSRLSTLVRHLHEDRLILNQASFFDRSGRRMEIEEVTRH